MREPRVRRRLSRILKEVKTECGDSNASSDDDGQPWFDLFINFIYKFSSLISSFRSQLRQ